MNHVDSAHVDETEKAEFVDDSARKAEVHQEEYGKSIVFSIWNCCLTDSCFPDKQMFQEWRIIAESSPNVANYSADWAASVTVCNPKFHGNTVHGPNACSIAFAATSRPIRQVQNPLLHYVKEARLTMTKSTGLKLGAETERGESLNAYHSTNWDTTPVHHSLHQTTPKSNTKIVVERPPFRLHPKGTWQ